MLTQFILPRGRLARLEFWRGVAVVGIGLQLALLADGIVGFLYAVQAEVIGLVSFAIVALSAWPIVVLSAQRLHDRDASGWWALISLLPVLGQIWLVWNGARPGTTGANRFGTSPRSSALGDVFGDGAAPAAYKRPPVVSTIAAWLGLVLLTVFMFLSYRAGTR